jgi:hypothetical protein
LHKQKGQHNLARRRRLLPRRKQPWRTRDRAGTSRGPATSTATAQLHWGRGSREPWTELACRGGQPRQAAAR